MGSLAKGNFFLGGFAGLGSLNMYWSILSCVGIGEQ